MSPGLWKQTCEFFNHDPLKNKLSDKVKVYGMERELKVYQAMAVMVDPSE